MKYYITLQILVFLFSTIYTQEEPSVLMESVLKDQSRRVEVIKRISSSVVCVFGENPSAGGGSGVLIHMGGYAVTNFHVVQPVGLKGKAGLNDHNLYEFETLGIDPGGDLSVIKLKGKAKYDFATFKSHRTLSVGDFCMALGNPFLLAEDYTPTITFGVVSGLNRFQEGNGRTLVYGDCIQIDSSINPGNSGGPLFTDEGYLVGINGRGSFEERGRVNVGLGYAISSLQIIKFLPDLMSTKICMHGTLNANFKNKTDGVVCFQLNLDGNAAKAGLKVGDKLISFCDLPILHSNMLMNYVSTYPANWPVKLQVNRKGEIKDIWFRIEPMPYNENKEESEPNANAQKSIWGEVGKVRDEKINESEAKRVVEESSTLLGKIKDDSFIFSCKISSKVDEKTREYLLKITNFEEVSLEDVYKSKTYKLNCLPEKVYEDDVEINDGLLNRQLLELVQPIYQWYILINNDENVVKHFSLLGGDLAKNRPAFQIEMKCKYLETEKNYYYYFDIMNDQFEMKPQLLKVAILDSGMISNYSFVYDTFVKSANGIQVPGSINLVRGFDEQVILSYNISEVKINE